MAKRTFPVEYAVLGLLAERPQHGYALRKRVNAALSPLWAIATSQIYSALHSLKDKGWVSVEEQRQESRPSRNVYLITPVGRREFERWCTAPVRHLRDMRVEFLAKLYFLLHEDSEAALALIDTQKEALKHLLARVSQRNDQHTDDPILASLAARFRVHQISAAIAWLAEGKEALTTEGDTDELQDI